MTFGDSDVGVYLYVYVDYSRVTGTTCLQIVKPAHTGHGKYHQPYFFDIFRRKGAFKKLVDRRARNLYSRHGDEDADKYRDNGVEHTEFHAEEVGARHADECCHR